MSDPQLCASQCYTAPELHCAYGSHTKELETVHAGDLAFTARSLLEKQGRQPDGYQHITLLYKGLILNEDWMLAGLNIASAMISNNIKGNNFRF